LGYTCCDIRARAGTIKGFKMKLAYPSCRIQKDLPNMGRALERKKRYLRQRGCLLAVGGGERMSEHLLEMAKARVLVKDGKIEVLSDPKVLRCPLRKDLYGIEEESRDSVERVLREHIAEMGMYGPERVLEMEDRTVSFGASEILADAMAAGMVDCAVVACEGAGTVVIARSEVLLAVGAHMTGLLKTEPISEIQSGLEERGSLLLDASASIDQIAGFQKAIAAGFRMIAVTVAGASALQAAELREMGRHLGIEPAILAVHTTGISAEEAKILGDCCDLIWSCASKAVREVAGRHAKLQMGISIPVFAMTEQGKRLLLNRAVHFRGTLVLHRAALPVIPPDKQPRPQI
jgi:putative methanogenesis marker protein 8